LTDAAQARRKGAWAIANKPAATKSNGATRRTPFQRREHRDGEREEAQAPHYRRDVEK